jgi:hypothetical protein
MNKVIFIFLLCLNVWPINYRAYNLSGGFSTLWDGMGRDWKGNIYVGAGNHSNNAALFKYNPVTDGMEIITDVRTVSQAVNNWLALDAPGKIHTSIKQGYDGKMYFASHSANEGDSADYVRTFRGGHFYCYDPKTGVTTDLSAPDVGIPNQGIMDVALGLDYHYVYGIGYPLGHLYKQNISSHLSEFIIDSQQKGGAVPRNIFADNAGRLFCPIQMGRFLIYDPASGATSISKGLSG